MKQICTKIQINATPEIVWNIITDFENYSKWNPFIREISGVIKEGSKIQVYIKPPNSSGMKFKPKILKYDPKKEIRWLGKLWISRMFDGEHSLIIKKIDRNRVLFIQKEQFNGLLIPLFTNIINDTKSGFQIMNQRLKKEAEEKME